MEYGCVFRTNYFHVTDEKAYKQLYKQLDSKMLIRTDVLLSQQPDVQRFLEKPDFKLFVAGTDKNILPFDKSKMAIDDYIVLYRQSYNNFVETARVLHNFGGYGKLKFYDDNNAVMPIEKFCDSVKNILPPNEFFLYEETGHEGLNYIKSYALLTTSSGTERIDIDNQIKTAAEKALGLKKEEWNFNFTTHFA